MKTGALWSVLFSLAILGCEKITSPEDLSPPETPAHFNLVGGGDGQVYLRWDSSREPDFSHYVVYRTTDLAQPFLDIAELRLNEFIDQYLAYDSTYYYYATTVDLAGNESKPTDHIEVQPLNISPPGRPQGLQVYGRNWPFANDVAIYLNWTPGEEGDLDHYYIYRSTDPQFSPSGSTLVDSTKGAAYRDLQVDVDRPYYYGIQAVDRGGKRSNVSEYGTDLILPQARLITPTNGVIVPLFFEFNWQSVPAARAYRIFVSRTPFSGELWSSATLADTVTRIVYTGPSLQAGQSHYWWVAAYSQVAAEGEGDARINSQSEIARFSQK